MMIQEKYKPYPKYKLSGVEWIREIPEGWELRKIKWASSITNSNVDKKTEKGEKPILLCNYIDVYKNDLIDDSIDFMEASATVKEINKFILRENDVIITKDSEEWSDIAIPAYVTKDFSSVICGYHLALIRPRSNKLYGKYLFRQLQSKPINTQFMVSANGITRFGLGLNSISSAYVMLPPLPEQQAIADFIDRETARINSIVEKQTRMIELLKEERSALITWAVTKGLDPKAKMKDSGIEWIGEIPENWEVRKIKWCLSVSFTNGVFKKAGFFGSGTKLVNVFDIYRDNYIVDYASLERVIVETNELKTYSALDGDIFFVRSSLKEEGIAAAACLKSPKEDTVFECHLIRARPNNNLILSTYLIYQLNSFLSRQRQVSLSQTVTMTTIAQPKLGILEILIPKIAEQKAIVTFLDRETAKIDTLIGKIEKQVELLSEYKQSLITDAVTGKIDVRGEAYAQNS